MLLKISAAIEDASLYVGALVLFNAFDSAVDLIEFVDVVRTALLGETLADLAIAVPLEVVVVVGLIP